MERARSSLLRPILLALIVVVVSYFFVSDLSLKKIEIGFPLDDSWIHYVYARNAANGEIFTYNSHEKVIGLTSPLWASLIVPAFWLSRSHEFHIWWGIVLGIVFHLLAGLAVYISLRKFDGSTAFLVALCMLTTGRLVWASLSGMETSLFYFLCLLSFAMAARVKETKRGAVLLGLALILTVYARPEGYLFAALIVLWLFIRMDEGKFVFDFRTPFEVSLMLILLISPYIVGTYVTWGHPLSTTFYSKRLIISEHAILGDWLKIVFTDFWKDNFVMVLAAIYGAYAIFSGRVGERKFGLAFLWIITLIVAQGYLTNLVFHHGRYQMPVIPFVWILAGLGLVELAKAYEGRSMQFFGVAARHIPTFALCIAIASNIGDLSIWRNIYTKNVSSVNSLNVGMARCIKASIPHYATVAVNDVGAIRYFGDHNILDLMGIVSPKVISLAHEKRIKPFHTTYVRQMARLIFETPNLDYVAVFHGWFPFAEMFPEAFVPIYSTSGQSIDDVMVKETKTLYRVDKLRLGEYLGLR